MKKYSKHIIAFVVGLAIAAIVVYIRRALIDGDEKAIMFILSDATFVPGVLMVCFGLFILSINGGTFDMLVFGTKQFFGMFRKDISKKKNQTFYDYKQAKQGEKIEFGYLIIVGLFYLFLSIIFIIIYYNL